MNRKSILLVENNPQDEMLILRALKKVNLAKQVDFAEFAETVARLGVYWLFTNEAPQG